MFLRGCIPRAFVFSTYYVALALLVAVISAIVLLNIVLVVVVAVCLVSRHLVVSPSGSVMSFGGRIVVGFQARRIRRIGR